MRVLLISANTVQEPYPVYPLGLDYVARAICGDHQVRRLDMNCTADREGLPEVLRRFDPQAVGISLRNIDNTDARHPQGFIAPYRALVETVRRLTAAPIILGGSGFTIFPDEILRLLDADFGIAGEGENLAPLLAALARHETPSGIPGLVSRTAALVDSAPPALPVSRNFDGGSSSLFFYLQNGGMLNLQSKRGCPFRCVYCSYPHIEGHVMRREPPGQVAATALALQNAGAKYLFITDSAFNADIDHSLEVARAFKAAGLSIPWGGFFAPTRLPQDYFKILADCGLRHVEFGTESLDDAVLQEYGKPFAVKEVLQAHAAALQAGLYVAHYFLFGGPGETGETLTASFNNIDKLEKTVLFLFCGMRIYPHTRLYATALAEGQITAAQSLLEPFFYTPPGLCLAQIAERVEEKARGKENWVFAAGGEKVAKTLKRMYRRGHSGPLWEFLIR